MDRKKTSIIWTTSDENLQKIVDESSCLSHVLDKLSLSRTCLWSRSSLKERFVVSCIDTTKMDEKNQFAADSTSKVPNGKFFISGEFRNSQSAKKRLINDLGVKYKCVICNNDGLWLGEPISLQLDHIDGDRKNNTLENLRLLCPNCHSQTPTFRGRNSNGITDVDVKKQINKRKAAALCGCGATKEKRANLCAQCYNESERIPSKIIASVSELTDLIQNHSMIAIGKMFGVSDNAVRKRCRTLGIDLSLAKNSLNKNKK